ncbi:MAG: type I 3-dehydroquinate dehydratase [Alistipes sp.]|nr:type I 3-dehydroquinate dehydratase [Candidatus Minthomonas equi]
MKICTSLGYCSVSECVKTSIGEEMVEVRADLCGFSVGETVSVLKDISCEKILTVRTSDGGDLMEILGRLDEGNLDYVDLSLDAARDFSDRVRDAIHFLGGKYIVSFHDFKDTPCLDELYEIYDICVSRGADIVKIVTTASCTEDASRVLELYRKKSLCKPLVAFAMGECGSFSRRLCLMLGAPFTYCSPDGGKATASGQWCASRMRRSLSPEAYPIDLHHLPRSRVDALPCSKSFAQRAIIGAGLAEGRSVLRGYVGCDDTEAALRVIRSFGAVVRVEGDVLTIDGVSPRNIAVSHIDVGESGLLSRMMIPIASLFVRDGSRVTVDGEGTLRRRICRIRKMLLALQAERWFRMRGICHLCLRRR